MQLLKKILKNDRERLYKKWDKELIMGKYFL